MKKGLNYFLLRNIICFNSHDVFSTSEQFAHDLMNSGEVRKITVTMELFLFRTILRTNQYSHVFGSLNPPELPSSSYTPLSMGYFLPLIPYLIFLGLSTISTVITTRVGKNDKKRTLHDAAEKEFEEGGLSGM